MSTLRADMRAAGMALLTGYKAAHPAQLKQVYAGRTLSIFPPTAFIDGIDEPDVGYFSHLMQRTPTMRIRLIQGSFDSEDSVDSQDELIDGFIGYVLDNKQAVGTNRLLTYAGYDDEPGWVPEWMPVKSQIPYYSGVVRLDALSLERGLVP